MKGKNRVKCQCLSSLLALFSPTQPESEHFVLIVRRVLDEIDDQVDDHLLMFDEAIVDNGVSDGPAELPRGRVDDPVIGGTLAVSDRRPEI